MNGSSASPERIVGPLESSASSNIRINIRDTVESRVALDQFVRRLQSVAEAVFYIGVGAMRAAWEGIEKLWASARDTGARGPLGGPVLPKPRLRPVRIKVPVLPIDNYAGLTVDEVIRRLEGLAPDHLRILKTFEAEHKNRKTLLDAVDRALARSSR